MDPAIKDNPYTLLAHFLSPWKKPDVLEVLRQLIKNGAVQWEQILFQANNNLCSPLWYVCLRNDGLVDLLPDELKKYLQHLYEANWERNLFFEDALLELDKKFNAHNIPFILLKGGAALCDNLYNDSGARLLQDLDILIKPCNAEDAWQILAKSGYEEIPNQGRNFDGLPTDTRHHHLNSLRKSDTPVVIELHYKSGYAQAEELVPTLEAWENTTEILYSGVRLQVLNPTWRLINNTAHGLIPEAEFIKGTICLQQLADFAFLAKRYRSQINWQEWMAKGMTKRLPTQFLAYLLLAQQLMNMEPPAGLLPSRISRLHVARISAVGKYRWTYKNFSETGWQKLRSQLIRFVLRFYYLLKLPGWVWQNVCYTGGRGHFFLRLNYMFSKAFSPKSRAKI